MKIFAMTPQYVLVVSLFANWCSLGRGLSCDSDVLSQSREDAIRETYCWSDDVYYGTITGVTCNCMPSSSSSRGGVNMVRCHRYELDPENSVITTTLMTTGTCDNQFVGSEIQECSSLGNSLVSWGLRVEGPSEGAGDMPTVNLTQGSGGCNLSCPFNSISNGELQPCTYTVRVGEVYKGNYSTGEKIEVVGPDVIFSLSNRVLQVNTDYLAGIGGLCNPINEWSSVSSFSPSELNILRQNITCGQCALLPSITALLTASLLLLVLS